MPTRQILANGADITAAIQSRFMSLTVTDDTGLTSDTLEIVLDDSDASAPIQKPSKGAELEVFLGYDGVNERMGMFVCDEIEYNLVPATLTIRARGAIFDKTPKGKANLHSQKERSWPKGTKLGDMVAKIASEHGMQPAVSDSLKNIVLPHIDQPSESDLNLLVRIGKKYDAVVKPANGKLILAKRGESKSTSSQTLPTITITPADDITEGHVVENARDTSGTVIAYWHETKQSRRHEIKVGSGEPVKRLKQYFPTQEMAKAAAQSEHDKRDRKKSVLYLALPGRNDLSAEGKLVMSGFRDGVAGTYTITRVTHSQDKSGGYTSRLEAELPNDGDDEVEDEAE